MDQSVSGLTASQCGSLSNRVWYQSIGISIFPPHMVAEGREVRDIWTLFFFSPSPFPSCFSLGSRGPSVSAVVPN